MTTTTTKRLLLTAAVLVATAATSACTPLGAICGTWLATPCIICFNENQNRGEPRSAVDQSLSEVPFTPSMTTTSSY